MCARKLRLALFQYNPVHVEDATGMLGQKERWAREMIFWGRPRSMSR